LGAGSAARRTVASLQRARCATRAVPLVVAAESWSPGLPGVGERDVVLLRAGTEVFGDWLDRLRAAAATAHTGTVTPFANRGPLSGYPLAEGAAPEVEDGVDWPAVDRLAARHNGGGCLGLPAMGQVCVFLRRRYLLDMVAGTTTPIARRWRHVLAADVCVRYTGTDTALPALVAPAGPEPALPAALGGFLRQDPARFYRRALDLGRLVGAGPAMLLVTHVGGGGTERHVRELAAGLEQEGVPALVLRPVYGGRGLRLERFAVPGTPNLVYEPTEEYFHLLKTLQDLHVAHVHIHHLMGHGPELGRLLADLAVPYDWTIHDYQLICPRIQLFGKDSRYCGEPREAVRCNTCLAHNGDYNRVRDGTEITGWRAKGARWLAGARRVFVPHHDVAERLARYFPEVVFTERRHFENLPHARSIVARRRPGQPLRVAVLGALAPHKGAETLLACALDARERNLALEFSVIGGPAHRDADLRAAGVTITGEYAEGDVFDVLQRQQCHCALFLSLWPETYCYTLSIAMAGGLYVLGLDLGAIGARIREWGYGEVLPWQSPPALINDCLISIAARLVHMGPAPKPEFAKYHDLLYDYYGLGDGLTAPVKILRTKWQPLPRVRAA
jgi:glycosyltransferase involved in cell wall biosynthesis